MSRPRQVITIGKEVEVAFRLIPAGEFRMGQRGIRPEEEPVHWVRITRDYWMMETPVTQQQFAVWRKDHQSHFNGKPAHPVEGVTWRDAVEFARFLRPLVPAGWLACLPTEAEWEYACRAGAATQFYSGEQEENLKKVAWYGEDWETGSTHPVRSKGPESANEFDLHDMHGNVWEWCHDVHDSDAYRSRVDGVVDPGFAEREAYYLQDTRTEGSDLPRVLRGGSCLNSASHCRAAFRVRFVPGDRYWNFGFRLVLVPGPQTGPVGDVASGAALRGTTENPKL